MEDGERLALSRAILPLSFIPSTHREDAHLPCSFHIPHYWHSVECEMNMGMCHHLSLLLWHRKIRGNATSRARLFIAPSALIVFFGLEFFQGCFLRVFCDNGITNTA